LNAFNCVYACGSVVVVFDQLKCECVYSVDFDLSDLSIRILKCSLFKVQARSFREHDYLYELRFDVFLYKRADVLDESCGLTRASACSYSYSNSLIHFRISV
jgi:hypothetical protein